MHTANYCGNVTINTLPFLNLKSLWLKYTTCFWEYDCLTTHLSCLWFNTQHIIKVCDWYTQLIFYENVTINTLLSVCDWNTQQLTVCDWNTQPLFGDNVTINTLLCLWLEHTTVNSLWLKHTTIILWECDLIHTSLCLWLEHTTN